MTTQVLLDESEPELETRDSCLVSNPCVLGLIESAGVTVCGGLLAACFRMSKCCVHRTSNGNTIAIVNSRHCKWCKRTSGNQVQESKFDHYSTRTYLRGLFRLKSSDVGKLSELLSELTRIRGSHEVDTGLPFTCTPPYCTVENVRHISNAALKLLLEVDEEFVWGDNLIFNTTPENV